MELLLRSDIEYFFGSEEWLELLLEGSRRTDLMLHVFSPLR